MDNPNFLDTCPVFCDPFACDMVLVKEFSVENGPLGAWTGFCPVEGYVGMD